MVDVEFFWDVIGDYNSTTLFWQALIVLLLSVSFYIAIKFHKPRIILLSLGATNLYIGLVYFFIFGTEPIQFFFAGPLFIAIALLFFYESLLNPCVRFSKPTVLQFLLLGLYVLYPFISAFLGNIFPRTVLYIMPCPVISLSLVIYTLFEKRNSLLLLLMTIWGLTGVKAFFANAYEDLILLICGIYGAFLLINRAKNKYKRMCSSV